MTRWLTPTGLVVMSSRRFGTICVALGLKRVQLVPCLTPLLSRPFQEVQDEAQWEEATGRGEEAVPGARVHKDPCDGL